MVPEGELYAIKEPQSAQVFWKLRISIEHIVVRWIETGERRGSVGNV